MRPKRTSPRRGGQTAGPSVRTAPPMGTRGGANHLPCPPQRGRGNRGHQHRGGRGGSGQHSTGNIPPREAVSAGLRPAPLPVNPAWRVPVSLENVRAGVVGSQLRPSATEPSATRNTSTMPPVAKPNHNGDITKGPVNNGIRSGSGSANLKVSHVSAQLNGTAATTIRHTIHNTAAETSTSHANGRGPNSGFVPELSENRRIPTPSITNDGCGTVYPLGSTAVSHPGNADPVVFVCREPSTIRRFVVIAARDTLSDLRKLWNINRTQFAFVDPRELHSKLDVHAQLIKMALVCRDLRAEFKQKNGDWEHISEDKRTQVDSILEVILRWHSVIERRERDEEAKKQLARERAKARKIQLRNPVTAHERGLPSRTSQPAPSAPPAAPSAPPAASDGLVDVQTVYSSPNPKATPNAGETGSEKEDDGMNMSRPYLQLLHRRIRSYLVTLTEEVNRLRAEADEHVVHQESLDLITGSPIQGTRALCGFNLFGQPPPAKLTRHSLGLIEREGKVDMVAREIHGQDTPPTSENAIESPSFGETCRMGGCIGDEPLINLAA